MSRNAPVVYCKPVSGNPPTWRFKCPHCRRWHVHGAGPGHRVAHCHDSASPFYATGYVLALEPSKKGQKGPAT